MDFVHDQLATGRKLRVLTVVAKFSRYVLILDVRSNYRGEDMVNSLERVSGQIGYPKTIRVDNGTRVYLTGHGSVGVSSGCRPELQ